MVTMHFSNGLKYRAEPYIFLIRTRWGDLWLRKPAWLRELLFDSDYIKPASAGLPIKPRITMTLESF